MTRLKVTTVGSSVGIVLPKELLTKLRVQKGDTLLALETADGIELTAYDAELEEQMVVMEGMLHDYRDALRRLAG